jgi:hypothetical protein
MDVPGAQLCTVGFSGYDRWPVDDSGNTTPHIVWRPLRTSRVEQIDHLTYCGSCTLIRQDTEEDGQAPVGVVT